MSTEETRDNIAPEAQEEMSEESLNELRKIRRDKLKALQEAGRNPFLEEKWDVTAHSKDIKDNFDAMEDQEVVMRRKNHGFPKHGKSVIYRYSGQTGKNPVLCQTRRYRRRGIRLVQDLRHRRYNRRRGNCV